MPHYYDYSWGVNYLFLEHYQKIPLLLAYLGIIFFLWKWYRKKRFSLKDKVIIVILLFPLWFYNLFIIYKRFKADFRVAFSSNHYERAVFFYPLLPQTEKIKKKLSLKETYQLEFPRKREISPLVDQLIFLLFPYKLNYWDKNSNFKSKIILEENGKLKLSP